MAIVLPKTKDQEKKSGSIWDDFTPVDKGHKEQAVSGGSIWDDFKPIDEKDVPLVEKGINIALEGARGYVEGRYLKPLRFGIEVMKRIHPDPGAKYIEKKYGAKPEQLFGGNIPELPHPARTSALQDVVGVGTELLGTITGFPGKAAKGISRTVGPAVAKATGKRFAGALAGEAAGLGGMFTVSNPEAAKDVKTLVKTFGEGAILGSIFGATRLATIPKVGPLVNNIIRQFGTRGLAAVAGQYSPEIWKDIVRGGKWPDDWPQKVFNEALFSWFSWKKGSGKHITEPEISGIRKQARGLGLTAPGSAQEYMVDIVSEDINKIKEFPKKRISKTEPSPTVPTLPPPPPAGPVSPPVVKSVVDAVKEVVSPAKPTAPAVGKVVEAVSDVASRPKETAIDVSRKIPAEVQRIEEVGSSPSSVNKPQGLYTSPSNIVSPHEDLGGVKTTMRTNPGANVLYVGETELTRTNRGLVGESAGIAAAKKLIGESEVLRMMGLNKSDLAAELRSKYRDVDWAKYFDQQEMIEGIGGIEARRRGYDAIYATDKDPAFNEYVGLTDNAFLYSPAKAKEPWEMTRLEFATQRYPIRPAIRIDGDKIYSGKIGEAHHHLHKILPEDWFKREVESGWVDVDGKFLNNRQAQEIVAQKEKIPREKWTGFEGHSMSVAGYVEKAHQESVQKAVAEGKSVPPEVLKDYPDLMKSVSPAKPEPIQPVQPGRTPGEFPLKIDDLPPDAEPSTFQGHINNRMWRSESTGRWFSNDGEGNFKDVTSPGKITVSSGIPVWNAVKKIADYFESQYDADMRAESRRTTARILEATSRVFDRERRLLAGLKIESNLRRMGPAGEKIANSAVNFVKDHTQLFTRSMSAIKTSYELMRSGMGIPLLPSKLPVFRGKKDAMITRRLADMVEGKYPPVTPNEEAAVNLFRSVMKTYADAADALGIKISSPWGERAFGKGRGETYFPVEYVDVEAFLNSSKEHFRHLRDLYIEQYAKKQFPKEMADPEFASGALEKARAAFNLMITASGPAYRQDLASKHFGHLESERILTEADIAEIRAKWEKIYPGKPFPLERKYSITSVMDYLDRAAERLSWVQNFGQDIILPNGGGMIPERIKDFIDTLNIPDNQRYVNKFFRNYLGRSGETSLVEKATDFLRRWNAQKLFYSGIPNFTQWITNTLPNTPTDVWLKSLADAAKFPFDKVTKDFMSLTGASALSETHQFAHLGSKRPLDVFNRILLQLNGFNAGEIWNATHAAFSGKHMAEKYSQELIKSKGHAWRDPHRIAELKKLGFTDAGIKMMVETGQGPTLNQLADAAFYSRRMFQFMADAFSRPAWWRSPVGRLLTQFKGFAYSQTSLLYNEPLKEFVRFLNPTMRVDGKTEFALGRQGDPTKLAKAMIALPVAGYLVTTAKDWVYDKLGLNLYADILDGKSDGLKLFTYIMNAGGLGIAMDAALAINRGLSGQVSFLGGPTAGDMVKFAELAVGVIRETVKAVKYQDSGWLSLRLPTIKQYVAEFFAGISPEVKVVVTNLFKDYAKVRTANQWNSFYMDAREDYKHYFRTKGQAFADEYWHAMENTVGKEYLEKFGKKMNKPTPKEIAEWEAEQGKPVSERINMGGTTVNKIIW